MSDSAKVVQITGHAFPTPRVRRMAEVLHGPGYAGSLANVVEDALVVDGMAQALDRAFSAGIKPDGRIDLREAAMHLINEMKANQK